MKVVDRARLCVFITIELEGRYDHRSQILFALCNCFKVNTVRVKHGRMRCGVAVTSIDLELPHRITSNNNRSTPSDRSSEQAEA